VTGVLEQAYRHFMNDSHASHVVLELTPDEAAIVTAALRQFEPYWPSDAPDLSRAELLAGIRRAIDDVRQRLSVG
jgi:hypothetical protein